jgi:hypothetical protein
MQKKNNGLNIWHKPKFPKAKRVALLHDLKGHYTHYQCSPTSLELSSPSLPCIDIMILLTSVISSNVASHSLGNDKYWF